MVLGIHSISPHKVRELFFRAWVAQVIIMVPIEGKDLGQLNSNSLIFGWLRAKQNKVEPSFVHRTKQHFLWMAWGEGGEGKLRQEEGLPFYIRMPCCALQHQTSTSHR